MKKLIISAMILVAVLLVYDFVFAEGSSITQNGNVCAKGAHICADIRLSGVKYDLQSHLLKGTFGVDLNSTDLSDICNAAFSSSGGREWANGKMGYQKTCPERKRSGDCLLQVGENAVGGNKRVTWASLDCKETTLSESSGATEIWYPFDRYETTLSPNACVNAQPNSEDEICGKASKAENAAIGGIIVSIGDQNLMGTISSLQPGIYKLTLRRRLFVRLVSVIFLVLSLAFLSYLVSEGDPKDLLPKSLGFFATLWGLRALIVPSSITIFPTIIDYGILTIFCILFLLVFLKLYERKEKA